MRLPSAPWALLLVLSGSGCRTAPERLESFRATVLSQEVQVVEQTFHDVTLRDVVEVQVPPGTRVTRARVAVLLDKEELIESDDALDVVAGETGVATVTLTRTARYAASLADMVALEKRQTLPLRMRGTLTLVHDGDTRTLDVLRAKELRAPRLLVPQMKDVGAARYDNGEVDLHFYLGVFNPNAFPVRLRGVRSTLKVAGETVGESTVGQADVVAGSSTASFELEQFLDASHEELNKRLFKMSSIPYSLAGEVTVEDYTKPFELEGSLRLQSGH